MLRFTLGLFLILGCTQTLLADPIDVRDFFLGVWQVDYTTDAVVRGDDDAAVVSESLSWNISAVPFSSVLRGTSLDSNERLTSILIDFPEASLTPEGALAPNSQAHKGQFLSSSLSFLLSSLNLDDLRHADDDAHEAPEDDDFVETEDDQDSRQPALGDSSKWSPVFSFDFQPFPANVFYSSGAYGLSGSMRYQFLITDPKGFILNIIQQDASGAVAATHVVLGRKIVPPPEPSFFQKYSMMIMIGFMLVMQFFKARAQAGVAPEPEAAPANASQAQPQQRAATVSKSRTGNAEVVHHKTN